MSNSAAIYPLPGQNLDFQLTLDMSGFESQIDSRVAEHIKKLRAALRNGAPQSQMQSILDEALAPGSFHEAIGGIRVYAPEAVRLTLLKQQGTNAKPAIHRFI